MRIVSFLLALLLVACGSALDVMTVQGEWQLAELERCYDAELGEADERSEAMRELAFAAVNARYDPAFRMWRAYRLAVESGGEDEAKQLFAVFSALALGVSARCLIAIPEPVESIP